MLVKHGLCLLKQVFSLELSFYFVIYVNNKPFKGYNLAAFVIDRLSLLIDPFFFSRGGYDWVFEFEYLVSVDDTGPFIKQAGPVFRAYDVVICQVFVV